MHELYNLCFLILSIDYYNLFDDKLTATNYKEPISLSDNIITHGPRHGPLKLRAAEACAFPLKNPWAWALLEYAILVVWYTEDVLTSRPSSFLLRLPPLHVHPTFSFVACALSAALVVPENALWHYTSPFCQTMRLPYIKPLEMNSRG